MDDIRSATLIRVNKNFDKDYDVILYNDDRTPFEFVEFMLVTIFKYTEEEAFNLTSYINNDVSGKVGTYPKKLAEVRVKKAMDLAKANGFDSLKLEARRS